MYGIDINAKQVTRKELAEIIIDLDKKGMVPFSATKIAKHTSRIPGNGYEKVELSGYAGKGGQTFFMRVSQSVGNIGISYEDKVNRQRLAEGKTPDFVSKDSPYEFITTGVRKKGGEFYLSYNPTASSAEDHIVGCKLGELEIADEDVVEEATKRKSTKPLKESRQEVDEKINYKVMSFASIAAIRIDGVSYVLSDIDDLRLDAFQLVFDAD